jgi:predicted NBD/HSP70 family sugar kinase
MFHILTNNYNLPIKIMNNTDTTVQSEIHFGIYKILKNFIPITSGTGVESSTGFNRKIIIKHCDLANETALTKIYPDNLPSPLVKPGCLDKNVSRNDINEPVFKSMSTEQKYDELREYGFLYLSPKIATDPALMSDAIAVKAR